MKAGTQAHSPPALVLRRAHTILPLEGDLGAQATMMSLDAIPFLLGSEIQGWVPEIDFF